MNPEEEIALLKERVSVLERILLRQSRFVPHNVTHDNQEAIAERAKLFVAEQFNLPPNDLIRKNREMRLVWPRWIAIHLAYKYSGFGRVRIGRIFKRDKGSIYNALNSLMTEMEIDPQRRQQVIVLDSQFRLLIQPASELAA